MVIDEDAPSPGMRLTGLVDEEEEEVLEDGSIRWTLPPDCEDMETLLTEEPDPLDIGTRWPLTSWSWMCVVVVVGRPQGVARGHTIRTKQTTVRAGRGGYVVWGREYGKEARVKGSENV